MPFEELETEAKAPPAATLSYMRKAGKGGAVNGNRPPRLMVTLPTAICGLGKLPHHILMIGSGADLGKLRLKGVAKDTRAKGAVKPVEFKTHFIWRFGYVPRLGDEIFDKQACPVRRVGDDEFEIDVNPSWFETPPHQGTAGKK